jgi:hypothetical protein
VTGAEHFREAEDGDGMNATIADRVAKGALFLDEREPNWWRVIDLDALDMEEGCDCVLGQLHPRNPDEKLHYLGALRQFELPRGPDSDEDAALGFFTEDHREWPLLTEAWRDLIEARRAGEPR